jgi:pimeloyl-ACP methyl ester carboxylesterase
VTYWPYLVARSTADDYSLVANNQALKEAFLKLAWPPHAAKRRAGMLNDLRQADALQRYPFEKIAVPTLVIHGTADPFVPFSSAEHLATQVSRAKLLAFQNGGHLSFLTHQEKTRAAILDFIDAHSKGQ